MKKEIISSSATFQRLVMYIFIDLLFKLMTFFIDDFDIL